MIHRDLFAVMELDYSMPNPGWCVVRITRSRRDGSERCRDIRGNHSLGVRREAKLVHPSQTTLDLYVLAGNTIY